MHEQRGTESNRQTESQAVSQSGSWNCAISGRRPINQIYWFSKQIFSDHNASKTKWAQFFPRLRLPWRAAWTIWHDWTTTRRKLFQLLLELGKVHQKCGALMTQSAKGLSAARGTIKVHHRRGWTRRGRKRRRKNAGLWQFVGRLVELCCDKNRINGTDNEKMHSWPRGGRRVKPLARTATTSRPRPVQFEAVGQLLVILDD